MLNPVQVEVVLSNSERLPVADVWLTVDVLRASTVIVSWFAAGGDELYPAGSVEAARLLAERLEEEGKKPVLMGERNAIAPQGFDLGNSPLDITEELTRKYPCAVMATTNGTVAMLKAASTGAPVFAACARNAPAALSAALSRGRRIGIFCSGRKGRPAWDDTLCAGLMVAYLAGRFPGAGVNLADSARLAHLTWLGSKDFKSSMMSADHAVFLDRIGYGDDIDFASEIDVTQVVPELYEVPGPDGSMRAVLRPARPGAEEREPYQWTLPAASVSRGEERRYPVVPHSEFNDTEFAGAGIGNVFFAGEQYKKSRGVLGKRGA